MAISKQEQKALFRFNIIFPLLDDKLPRGMRNSMIEKICSKEYKIPYSKKTTLSPGTVWNWYYTYQKEGTIDSLAPAGRKDKGKRRSISKETEKELIRRHKEHPDMPIKYLVERAQEDGVFSSEDSVSINTIYQILKQEKHGYNPSQQDRRAYRAPSINDMWQSDAMHLGAKVKLSSGKMVIPKLFVCLDNKSRLICYAKWYATETAESYLDCLWRAFKLRGLPRVLYVDNGSSFRDERLKLGCASICVAISYARPYKPQGKGAVERFNRRVRQQFISVLPSGVITLDELNVRFEQWVDSYNHRVHSSLDGKSPLQVYLSELKAIRTAPEDLPLHFRRSDTRLVAADRTIRFKGTHLEVPIGYSGRKIIVRYFDHDPVHTCEGFFEGTSLGMLKEVDRVANFQAHRKGVSV